jgi:hypothetical protein
MPGISSSGDPASESAQPADETQAGSPTSVPQSQRTQPHPDPPAGTGNGRPRNRLFRTKVVRPTVLALTGVALGLIAYAIYPSRTQLPVPTYTTLRLTSDVTIDTVTYRVYQIHPSTAEVKISVLVSPNTALPAPRSQPPSLTVFLPIGMTCHPKPPCFNGAGGNNGWSQQSLTFKLSTGPGFLPNSSSTGVYAFADFTVRAKVFGVTYDGATASAAIPKLHYSGPGSPTLITQYQIASANKYDWSTLPPAFVSSSEAQWLEQMNGNSVLFDVDAVGTNHIAETRDNDLTFLAGVLLGVGGGALVAAGQEALHIKD